MKFSSKFFITALITGVIGVIQSFVTINDPDLSLSERIITYGLMGIIIYGIPVAIVVYSSIDVPLLLMRKENG